MIPGAFGLEAATGEILRYKLSQLDIATVGTFTTAGKVEADTEQRGAYPALGILNRQLNLDLRQCGDLGVDEFARIFGANGMRDDGAMRPHWIRAAHGKGANLRRFVNTEGKAFAILLNLDAVAAVSPRSVPGLVEVFAKRGKGFRHRIYGNNGKDIVFGLKQAAGGVRTGKTELLLICVTLFLFLLFPFSLLFVVPLFGLPLFLFRFVVLEIVDLMRRAWPSRLED